MSIWTQVKLKAEVVMPDSHILICGHQNQIENLCFSWGLSSLVGLKTLANTQLGYLRQGPVAEIGGMGTDLQIDKRIKRKGLR